MRNYLNHRADCGPSLIYFLNSVFSVRGMRTFKFAESVWFFVVLVGGSIVGHIHIPPGVVIVDSVPGVAGS